MRIDAHTHIAPPDWPDWSARLGAGPWPRLLPRDDGTRLMAAGEVRMPLDDRFWSAERRIADMDRLTVDMQVVSPVPLLNCYWAEAKASQTVTRFLNEGIAAFVAQAPARFAGMGSVPLQDTGLAVEELRYLRDTLHIHSVQIGTCPANRELDDPALLPFFDACVDLGMSVFVHPIEPLLGRARMENYYLPNIIGNPLESTLAMTRLICGGVLRRLPDLKIGFAHAGGAFPFVLGRLDKGYAVRAETGALIDRPPSAYARLIYVDALTFDAASLRLAVEKHGADRVFMGSDYPFALGETDPVAALQTAGLDAATMQRIADGNARDFLRL